MKQLGVIIHIAASTFCSKQFPPVVLITRASLGFFVDMLFRSGVLELIRSSLPPITLF